MPRKNATTEKTIIDGRTIMNTVEGLMTFVSATDATATMTTSGTTERGKSYSILAVVAGGGKSFVNPQTAGPESKSAVDEGICGTPTK
jgi:hypothetical protein